jgi:D-threo-aldose 1-dehydrogenase
MTAPLIGLTGQPVPALCLGTSPLGGMPTAYGYDVPARRAVATVKRALDSGLRFIDTANEYGDGESERRIGSALSETGPSDEPVVLASKADPKRGSRVLDGDRVLESFAESTQRLGVDRLDVYYLHDPERFDFSEITRPNGALDALHHLKEDGRVSAVGVAGGDMAEVRRYVDTGALDVVLNHNQYTLLDRSADALITECVDAGVAFVNAAPYASGILAKPLGANPRYQYRAPEPHIVETVTWLHEVCARFDVPVAALALQFSTRDVRIASTVVGVSTPERVDDLVRNAQMKIPTQLWDLIEEGLSRPRPAQDNALR